MTHFMTITRFVSMAWDWMDEGAPDAEPRQPSPFDRICLPDTASPDVTDLAIVADLSWVDNYNRSLV